MGELDSNPVAKSLESYHKARAYGASDGTMAGNLGVEDWRKQQAQYRSTSSQQSSSKNSADDKVICTELVRQGLFDRNDRLMGARFVQAT